MDALEKTDYIYLLIEREFSNSKEPIFKVGKTTKLNHIRFNQYLKNSVLLFQMICNDCNNMEKQIKDIFKKEFKQRKEIGSEYFEGKYQSMIDIIYNTIKNEKEVEKVVEEVEKEEVEKEEVEEVEKEHVKEEEYTVDTYETWSSLNNIIKIIITNKNGDGFLKLKGEWWRPIGVKYEETLLGYIEYWNEDTCYRMIPENVLLTHNEMFNFIYNYKHEISGAIISHSDFCNLKYKEKQNYYSNINKTCKSKFIPVNLEYDIVKIQQDIIKKCYNKKYDIYELKYHEYAIQFTCDDSLVILFILNSPTFTFTHIEEIINNKILTEHESGDRNIHYSILNDVDTNIVDDILNSLINDKIKGMYKKFIYNLLVEESDNLNIFYDYNECLLTECLKGVTEALKGFDYIYYSKYYDNKLEFKKLIKNNKPRCVIISKFNDIPIEKHIKCCSTLGFKNIIVLTKDKTNNMYNIINFRKYLQDNKEIILNCINKKEKRCEPDRFKNMFDDDVFYLTKMLLPNYLKWCCM